MKEGVMRVRLSGCLFSLCLTCTLFFSATGVHAQPLTVLKSGQSDVVQLVYQVVNCASIVVGNPEVEVLDGPNELTLEIKKGNVLPRALWGVSGMGQNCRKLVPGGTLVATVKEVTERKDATLRYRIKYKTKL